MRLMVVAFVVAILLIVDQLRFSGYYRLLLTDMVQSVVSRVVR
jgi:hypothetical protein